MELGIVIRGTNEATLYNLAKILERQKKSNEPLTVLNQEECFEEKMNRSFETGLEFDKPFTLIIDGDILVVNRFLTLVRKLTAGIPKNGLGFGLKVFDKFYHQPKYRGIHVYKTEWLDKALDFIPEKANKVLRPESYVKERLKEVYNIKWNNAVSGKIYGIHDFFQQPSDIFYKFLVRAHRSSKDYELLTEIFSKKEEKDFYYALEGLQKGRQLEEITNDKQKIIENNRLNFPLKAKADQTDKQVTKLLLGQLIHKYGFANSLFKKIPTLSVLPF